VCAVLFPLPLLRSDGKTGAEPSCSIETSVEMANTRPSTLTGEHKGILCAFLVWKLLEINATPVSESPKNDAIDTITEWVRVYGAAFLGCITGAEDKAAKFVPKFFGVLDQRAAEHITGGGDAASSQLEFDERFEEFYGAAPRALPAPKCTGKLKAAAMCA
jgi:hypothetical protein